MKRVALFLVALSLSMLLASPAARAVETRVTVRVRAHDAKFIGTGVGGVQVVVRDADTGRFLASGLVEGGTGDTKTLMKTPISRGQRLSDGSAAAYVATLDIDEPTRIEVIARGPLAAGSSVQTSSRTLWVLPGQDVTGDGVLLELQGFLVYPVTPAPHQFYRVGDEVAVEAHVTMMCGCPIKPGGLWDADKYAVKALVQRDGKQVAELNLVYAGATSRFKAAYRPDEPGSYKVLVTAADPSTNNFGVGVTSFVVKKAAK
ncbi:MAG: hypothetical protein GXP50_01490 [Deltaproteobacteria bacterium]|nr:hypothetical protein [Deltaproteobacteria bacterium]